MTNSVLLEKAIDESGLMKKYIAGRLGLTSFGLSKKINNHTEFKASEIMALCEILSLNRKDREAIFFSPDVE